MLFSSISFLFFFLPCLLLCYYICPKKYRNYVLFLFSILFYYLGEKKYLFLLLISCFINYIFGKKIYKTKTKIFLILGLLFNLGLLFYFKYANFFFENINYILPHKLPILNVVLPLGISFFTFQNISYLIDVYRSDAPPEKNFFKYTTYITLFPQLVAGPIVRYKDVSDELNKRKESFLLFSEGVKRFIIGLAKKVLIADTIYFMYSNILKTNMAMLSYILVAICFTLQIYYDFSGYSDMAIGLGKMFGFNFKENFNYPLISFSITEFWQRWHISLSSFFKDYVYIPLGGNRCSKMKNIRNILIVWMLTGIWHGASWNFILWGLYYGIILILEKFILAKWLEKLPAGIKHIYAIILILIGWTIFAFDDIHQLFLYLKNMFFLGKLPFINGNTIYLGKNFLILLVICLLASIPLTNLKQKLKIPKIISNGAIIIFYLFIFIASVAYLVDSSYNPFLYFRF